MKRFLRTLLALFVNRAPKYRRLEPVADEILPDAGTISFDTRLILFYFAGVLLKINLTEPNI
ncbi:hypothetical protein [Adhaeribacter rhizoryzae]|uniref:Uncharacterized protein n=1 Tax=Adhaeribacter rhizoryzae TaxID=2607907 RepID=A0A5M6D559_9BACT|nr:hypothetical protein [Adhaeribacter rhizoryzae]KAA5540345.1 hypothetical protein F0145_22825 [Adhaeribacter rhizoryzae]